MLTQIFTSHPRRAGETYFQHQRVAFHVGFTMLAAGFAAVIHGLVPCFFETTGSRAVSRLSDFMRHRGR